jgi:hypothetical protein
MKIEYFHDSKYGNGAAVAEEFKKQMAGRNAAVNIHAVKDTKAKDIPSADLYVFSSPGRMGSPTWRVTRFLKKLALPKGAKYAVLTTEGAPVPDKKTGKMPTEEERAKWQRVIPKMEKILDGREYAKVAEGKIYVTGMRGPLEEGWQTTVAAFVKRIPA